MYSSIVVGTDGSPTAARAVERATELAVIGKARLHLVSVNHSPGKLQALHSMGAGMVTVDLKGLSDEHAAELKTGLDTISSDLQRRGIDVETYLCTGDPADMILDVATTQGADLIVVGNKGMTGAKRLLGSVPNKVAHNSPCDVLIVYTT